MSPSPQFLLSSFFAVATLIAGASQSRADQCVYVQDLAARNLPQEVHPGEWVVEFCENCNDLRPGEPIQVESVKLVRSPDYQDSSIVFINGEEMDLAYTYHSKTRAGIYTNLAHITGCPSEGSRHEIMLPFAESEAPSQTPLTTIVATPPAPEAPAPTSNPPQSQKRPLTVVVQSSPQAFWALVLSAASALGFAGILLFLGVGTRRRWSHRLGRFPAAAKKSDES